MAAGALRGSPVHEVLEVLAIDLHARVSLTRLQRGRLASARSCSIWLGCAMLRSKWRLDEASTGAEGRTCVRMLEMASTSSYCELLLVSLPAAAGALPAGRLARRDLCVLVLHHSNNPCLHSINDQSGP